MSEVLFPVIDPVATGKNILRLRNERGLTVRDLQRWFGFEEPRAIYKWQKGESLPSLDNFLALSVLLRVSMNDIIVAQLRHIATFEPQAIACGSALYHPVRLSFVALSVTQTASQRIGAIWGRALPAACKAPRHTAPARRGSGSAARAFAARCTANRRSDHRCGT